MLKHIVMWKFREEAEGAPKCENLTRAKELLGSLPSKISAIKQFAVGIDVGRTEVSYDLVLESTFENYDSLLEYQRHPAHREVVDWLRRVHQGRVVVDFLL